MRLSVKIALAVGDLAKRSYDRITIHDLNQGTTHRFSLVITWVGMIAWKQSLPLKPEAKVPGHISLHHVFNMIFLYITCVKLNMTYLAGNIYQVLYVFPWQHTSICY